MITNVLVGAFVVFVLLFRIWIADQVLKGK
jgi:hypothetical protein